MATKVQDHGASAKADQAIVASPSSRSVPTEGFDPSRSDILSVIARAAADPNVDIDKLERLLLMQERVIARNARTAYYDALAEMQPKLPIVDERGAISTDRGKTVQSTYALWEDVNEAIRPILCEHGFALTFKVRRTESEIVTTGILSHRDGHREETELGLPSDSSGSKNAVQAIGSSTSYGKRYTAYALLNITTRGNDDDGQKGGAPVPVDDVRAKVLNDLADAVGADKIKFCKHLKVTSLKDLPADKYDEALRLLKEKNHEAAERFLTGKVK